MKAIAISGSPRKGGNTEYACQVALEKMAESGIETELISLAGKNIKPCIACGKCADAGKCVGAAGDDFDGIIEKVKPAQAIILASPVYFNCATGPICNLMHRMGYVARCGGDNFLSRKVGGAIAVARRAGHNFTFAQLSMFFSINDMVQAGSSYWNVGVARAIGDMENDTEGIETLKRFGENISWLLEKLY